MKQPWIEDRAEWEAAQEKLAAENAPRVPMLIMANKVSRARQSKEWQQMGRAAEMLRVLESWRDHVQSGAEESKIWQRWGVTRIEQQKSRKFRRAKKLGF